MFTFMRNWKETFSVTQQVVRTRNIRDVRLCILAVAMPTGYFERKSFFKQLPFIRLGYRINRHFGDTESGS